MCLPPPWGFTLCAILLVSGQPPGCVQRNAIGAWHPIEPWVCPSLAIADNTGGGGLVKIRHEGREGRENKMGDWRKPPGALITIGLSSQWAHTYDFAVTSYSELPRALLTFERKNANKRKVQKKSKMYKHENTCPWTGSPSEIMSSYFGDLKLCPRYDILSD